MMVCSAIPGFPSGSLEPQAIAKIVGTFAATEPKKIATALVCSRSFSLWFMVDLMYQVLVDGWIWTAPWKWGWYFPYDETQLLLRLLPLQFGLRNGL